jgi:hypothetical protein
MFLRLSASGWSEAGEISGRDRGTYVSVHVFEGYREADALPR